MNSGRKYAAAGLFFIEIFVIFVHRRYEELPALLESAPVFASRSLYVAAPSVEVFANLGYREAVAAAG